MNQEELDKILKDHALCLLDLGGKLADFSEKILEGADFLGANLEGADFLGANLQGANLKGANLKGANLKGAWLFEANLSRTSLLKANLKGANLEGANLTEACLKEASLEGTNLERANLLRANLERANLKGANLERSTLQEATLQGANLQGVKISSFQIVPESGRFIAWKKLYGDKIAKLEIPASAQRTSSLIGRKCRASQAKVLSIESLDGKKKFKDGWSLYDVIFPYKVGEYVLPEKEFDDDIRIECASGIHFFITKEEAVKYKY